jgi:hypothetical protein
MAKAGIAFLFLVIAVVAYAFAHFAQQRTDSVAFVAIEMGDSTLDVVNALGEPDAIRECSENLWWGGDHKPLGKNDGRCVDEYYYSSMPNGWDVHIFLKRALEQQVSART